jgi:hypothetical protein
MKQLHGRTSTKFLPLTYDIQICSFPVYIIPDHQVFDAVPVTGI